MDVFKSQNASLTVGLICSQIGGNVTFVNYLKANRYSKGIILLTTQRDNPNFLFEFAAWSYTYPEDYSTLPYAEQVPPSFS